MREVGVSASFPEEVQREAESARPSSSGRERVDLDFATIDPPGSHDLDQAMHIERLGGGSGGFRVSYAIADVGSLVDAGTALDAEAHARGVTVYAPDAKAPLYPLPLSEGSGSLLPNEWRPAVLWTIDLDERGAQRAVDVRRAEVRSVAQHTYTDIPAWPRRPARRGRRAARGARTGAGWRQPPPARAGGRRRGRRNLDDPLPGAPGERGPQRPDIAAHGDGGRRTDAGAGVGILRTQEAPDERSLARFRLQAEALGHDWPEGMPYPEFIRSIDAADPRGAALLQEAAGIGRGARYEAFDGDPPAQIADRFHFSIAADYAHATAPLRRLQDRYVSECCIAAAAGDTPPDWVRAGLTALPDLMQEADRRASAVERGVVDLVEAMILTGREGETFDALVVDDDTLQLVEPAVRTRIEGGCPEPGVRVRAKFVAVDTARRSVSFEVDGRSAS